MNLIWLIEYAQGWDYGPGLHHISQEGQVYGSGYSCGTQCGIQLPLRKDGEHAVHPGWGWDEADRTTFTRGVCTTCVTVLVAKLAAS